MRKRTGRPLRFAAIPNETIDDAVNLDLTALGLLAVLIRHRDGWDVTLADIGARYGYGERVLARAMGMLQVARYVVKIRVMDLRGLWSTEIVVYDTPATDEEIADLLASVRDEPDVRDVQIIPPTKTAQAYATKRREKLRTDSTFFTTRCDLRKHSESRGRTDSRIYRHSVSAGVSKKTSRRENTKDSSSPNPLTSAQPSRMRPAQEEEGSNDIETAGGGRTDAARDTKVQEHADEAAALVAELPAVAAQAGRPLGRRLRVDEASRLTTAITDALARGWTTSQLRGALTEGLGSAQSVVATWHHRLAGLGDPPTPAAGESTATALPPWCGQCAPNRRLETPDGEDGGPCPRCNPRAIRRAAAAQASGGER